MTLTVEDDFAAFVGARWAELEALALVTTLDPVSARDATTRALSRLRSTWANAVDDGTPTLWTRRAVLERSLHVAGSAAGGPESLSARPGSSSRDLLGAGGEQDDAIADSLWHCLSHATASQRAVLACAVICDLDTKETAHLMGLPVADVEAHSRFLRSRLAQAHGYGRASTGLPPAEWLLDDDLRSLLDDLVEDTPEPPDPAALVAAKAAGVRRRTVVLAGTAVMATAGAGWLLARSVGGGDAASAGAPTLSPGDVDWASTKTWPARGALAADVGVLGLVLSRTSSGSRLLFADDVGDRRIVLAAPIGIPTDSAGTQVRAWQGERDALPDTLEEIDLPRSFIDGVSDVVAIHLPQATGSALVVLTRPGVGSAAVSRFVRPTPVGMVEREWAPLRLDDGVGINLSGSGVSPAMRLRVGGYDGAPANSSLPWVGVELSSGLTSLTESTSALVASATGDPLDTVVSTVVADSLTDGSILDPLSASATGGDGRVVVVSTRTSDGAALRSVFAEDDGRSGASTVVLESVDLIPAGKVNDPTLVRILDADPDTGRFLVVAAGGALAQLLATSPNAYPVSKVTPFKADTVIVSVINADDASAFRLIVSDARGRKIYEGVPSTGTELFDLQAP